MSAETDFILAVTDRLYVVTGEPPTASDLNVELARVALEAKAMYREERTARVIADDRVAELRNRLRAYEGDA